MLDIKTLQIYAASISEETLNNITKFLDDYPFFAECSGSSKEHQHHYGDGGLAKHTREVIEIAVMNAKYVVALGKHHFSALEVFYSAFFHDVGKMYDYAKVDGKWVGTEHKRRIHHIARSALIWQKFAESINATPELTDNVLHAILAHHGQREWGSPVAPKTALAWLLHLSDGISARMDDCDKWDRY